MCIHLLVTLYLCIHSYVIYSLCWAVNPKSSSILSPISTDKLCSEVLMCEPIFFNRFPRPIFSFSAESLFSSFLLPNFAFQSLVFVLTFFTTLFIQFSFLLRLFYSASSSSPSAYSALLRDFHLLIFVSTLFTHFGFRKSTESSHSCRSSKSCSFCSKSSSLSSVTASIPFAKSLKYSFAFVAAVLSACNSPRQSLIAA